MKNDHVVSGLIAKRAELAGKIESLQAQVKQAVIELDHIDAALRIFDPNIDLEAITPRRVPNAHHAFRGEVSRIVLEALRKTRRPMSTHAFAAAMTAGGPPAGGGPTALAAGTGRSPSPAASRTSR